MKAKGNLFDIYFTALQLVLCRVSAVEHHHSADFISFPLGSLDPLWYI